MIQLRLDPRQTKHDIIYTTAAASAALCFSSSSSVRRDDTPWPCTLCWIVCSSCFGSINAHPLAATAQYLECHGLPRCRDLLFLFPQVSRTLLPDSVIGGLDSQLSYHCADSATIHKPAILPAPVGVQEPRVPACRCGTAGTSSAQLSAVREPTIGRDQPSRSPPGSL